MMQPLCSGCPLVIVNIPFDEAALRRISAVSVSAVGTSKHKGADISKRLSTPAAKFLICS
jgi:hypothetical protein